MKDTTERLLYSLQSGICTSRNSIREAYTDIQRVIDTTPAKYSAPMQIYLQILLNSIVAEVMATENKVEEFTDNMDVGVDL